MKVDVIMPGLAWMGHIVLVIPRGRENWVVVGGGVISFLVLFPIITNVIFCVSDCFWIIYDCYLLG